jgi:3-oxosteroid 1-dehydrogenase
MARVGIRMLQNRFGKKLVGLGAALQGRLLEMALRRDVPIWLSSEVQQLMIHDGRAGGVVMHRNSRISHVEARSAVLLDSGGFARNAQMRARFQRAPIGSDWTSANPGDTGEIIRMAMDAGAAAHGLDQSWWVSSSVFPDGSRGQHHADMAKPHCILVDQSGRRYVNEATSYVKVGEIMYARNATVLTIPSWLIMDARHRSRYRWAGRPPGRPPAHWISSGYMMTAKSIEELARACNIDPASLQATVSRFNGFARAGRDEDFGRGVSAYSRVVGDPTVSPNASLGAIERPPFYAVRLYPGDVGTSGGLVTDEFARVLRSDGTPIYGLYAAGNCTASVVGRSYPGAGASIGAALVFGYAAAMHVIQS